MSMTPIEGEGSTGVADWHWMQLPPSIKRTTKIGNSHCAVLSSWFGPIVRMEVKEVTVLIHVKMTADYSIKQQ